MEGTELMAGLERAALATVAIGADGRVSYSSRAASELFGDLSSVNLSTPPGCEDPRSPLATLIDAWEGLRGETATDGPRLVRARTHGLPAFLWVHSVSLGDGGRLFLFTDLTAFLTGSEPVRRLLSQIAHDLNSPLTSISGAAELLLSGRVGGLQGVQEKLIRIVEEGAGKMNSIIRNAAEEGKGREEGGNAA